MMKRLLSLILICYLLTVSVFALPSPTKEFYINDFANVVEEKVEKHILNMSALLKKETGAQIVVVTVPDLEGMNDSDYALKLGREWGIGDKDKDNGFLMLISTGDRALRFEVGYGLEGALPDGKCGRIQDEYMIPYLSENNYSEAVLKGYDQIIAEVCKEYGIEIPDEIEAQPMEEEEEDIGSMIIALVFIVVIIYCVFKGPKKFIPTSGGHFYGGFHGGFGGHSGSSGGGFRGGGGSFGGGGSSRKF